MHEMSPESFRAGAKYFGRDGINFFEEIFGGYFGSKEKIPPDIKAKLARMRLQYLIFLEDAAAGKARGPNFMRELDPIYTSLRDLRLLLRDQFLKYEKK